MVLSCLRCSQSNNGPSAFLLLCGNCKRAWHHRCHIPPVEDNELIQRIRSTNAGDHDNGLAGWSCKRCKKKQAPQTSIKTTVQLSRPDDSTQQPSAGTQGVIPPNDQNREADTTNITTTSDRTRPASSTQATTQVSHNVKGTELSDHGSRYRQQQSRHSDSYMGNTGTDAPQTTVDKRLSVKRVLQEQRHDCPGADHGSGPDQPAASTKYARAPDGRKLVSPEHSSRPLFNLPRSTASESERTTHSPFASRPDQEDEHYGSVVESPGEGAGQKKSTLTDTASRAPTGIEHGDIGMRSLDDDSDDFYNTPTPQFRSSTPGPSGSKQQERNEETDDDAGDVLRPNDQSSLRTQTPDAEAEAPLGPSWLKARYSVADDPWHRFCHQQPRTYGDRKRKKPKAKFLGDVVHSTVTLDRGLLEYLFFRDWFHQTQAEIAL